MKFGCGRYYHANPPESEDLVSKKTLMWWHVFHQKSATKMDYATAKFVRDAVGGKVVFVRASL